MKVEHILCLDFHLQVLGASRYSQIRLLSSLPLLPALRVPQEAAECQAHVATQIPQRAQHPHLEDHQRGGGRRQQEGGAGDWENPSRRVQLLLCR